VTKFYIDQGGHVKTYVDFKCGTIVCEIGAEDIIDQTMLDQGLISQLLELENGPCKVHQILNSNIVWVKRDPVKSRQCLTKLQSPFHKVQGEKCNNVDDESNESSDKVMDGETIDPMAWDRRTCTSKSSAEVG
jgi:hypothetical protein